MSWNLNPEYPIYTQIMEHITSDIISGAYTPVQNSPLFENWRRLPV